MFPTPKLSIDKFRGLNNVRDPMRGSPADRQIGKWEWQQVADNINITDDGQIVTRDGYIPFLPIPVASAYSTFHYDKLFVLSGTDLLEVFDTGSTITRATNVVGPVYWAEVNDEVYVSARNVKLQILPDGTVRPWGVPTATQPSISGMTGNLFPDVYKVCCTFVDAWGREGGASPATEFYAIDGGMTISNIPQLAGYTTNVYVTEGVVFYRVDVPVGATSFNYLVGASQRELTNMFLDEPPLNGTYITHYKGRMYISEYFPQSNMTVVWESEPLAFHNFNYNSGYLLVPGEVTQMVGTESVMCILTRNRTYLYDGEAILQAAEYGAVPGQHVDIGSDGKAYFWTTRGLCSVAPFENLTEKSVSVAPGISAGGGIIEQHGYKRFVAIIEQGGEAFNKR